VRDYPEEFDGGYQCEVCAGHTDGCQCPDCPVCGTVGDPQCYEDGHIDKAGLAFNIADLATHLGAARGTESSVAKRLFKDTRCGICFEVSDSGRAVVVAGYAEGSGDACCEPIEMPFPIDLAEFDKAVERADQEGCDLWDEHHCHICGCETGYEEPCEECDGEEHNANRSEQ
jgi:hypothetical protein